MNGRWQRLLSILSPLACEEKHFVRCTTSLNFAPARAVGKCWSVVSEPTSDGPNRHRAAVAKTAHLCPSHCRQDSLLRFVTENLSEGERQC